MTDDLSLSALSVVVKNRVQSEYLLSQALDMTVISILSRLEVMAVTFMSYFCNLLYVLCARTP